MSEGGLDGKIYAATYNNSDYALYSYNDGTWSQVTGCPIYSMTGVGGLLTFGSDET